MPDSSRNHLVELKGLTRMPIPNTALPTHGTAHKQVHAEHQLPLHEPPGVADALAKHGDFKPSSFQPQERHQLHRDAHGNLQPEGRYPAQGQNSSRDRPGEQSNSHRNAAEQSLGHPNRPDITVNALSEHQLRHPEDKHTPADHNTTDPHAKSHQAGDELGRLTSQDPDGSKVPQISSHHFVLHDGNGRQVEASESSHARPVLPTKHSNDHVPQSAQGLHKAEQPYQQQHMVNQYPVASVNQPMSVENHQMQSSAHVSLHSRSALQQHDNNNSAELAHIKQPIKSIARINSMPHESGHLPAKAAAPMPNSEHHALKHMDGHPVPKPPQKQQSASSNHEAHSAITKLQNYEAAAPLKLKPDSPATTISSTGHHVLPVTTSAPIQQPVVQAPTFAKPNTHNNGSPYMSQQAYQLMKPAQGFNSASPYSQNGYTQQGFPHHGYANNAGGMYNNSAYGTAIPHANAGYGGMGGMSNFSGMGNTQMPMNNMAGMQPFGQSLPGGMPMNTGMTLMQPGPGAGQPMMDQGLGGMNPNMPGLPMGGMGAPPPSEPMGMPPMGSTAPPSADALPPSDCSANDANVSVPSDSIAASGESSTQRKPSNHVAEPERLNIPDQSAKKHSSSRSTSLLNLLHGTDSVCRVSSFLVDSFGCPWSICRTEGTLWR